MSRNCQFFLPLKRYKNCSILKVSIGEGDYKEKCDKWFWLKTIKKKPQN